MNFHCRLLNISNISKSLCSTRNNLLKPQCISAVKYNNVSTNTVCYIKRKQDPSLVQRVISKLPFVNLSKSRLKVTGYLLYESVADKLSYADFFKELNLPDTFYSWFVITELHVWMLLARTMAEGEDGRLTRNNIVQAMWADVNTRVKKLGSANPSGVRMQVDELSQQFQAALVAYDEGLLSNDKILASALWRRFFQQQCTNPEHLELLVRYVRKQILILDDISSHELLEQRKITWTPLFNK